MVYSEELFPINQLYNVLYKRITLVTLHFGHDQANELGYIWMEALKNWCFQ